MNAIIILTFINIIIAKRIKAFNNSEFYIEGVKIRESDVLFICRLANILAYKRFNCFEKSESRKILQEI
ncbi:hypothetical protein G9F72_001815 [Clostridium estertheticum]|uniref:hypothetical protein n=1 Tax=Clostridium estertheticum TaxID=238834 RepID=UPI0013E969B2|nr:hypothetical protein [Clostridium estertheticum]MBZ9685092.1 hypothetical protein [Clostridium estertheticum]